MTNTIKNISLYIKRAEQMHTKEYIMSAFQKAQYGKVKDVKFIEKKGETGPKYNGAIVIFDLWFNNKKVTSLFDSLQTATDGCTKIIHDEHKQRYWYVMEYKVKTHEVDEYICDPVVSTSLSKDEQIQQLTKLVHSLTSQMHYFETTNQKNEQRMMDYERVQVNAKLLNDDHKFQLFLLDLEADRETEDFKKIQENLEKENAVLKDNLLVKAEECTTLTNELYDNENILNYYESNSVLRDSFLRNSYN